MDQQIGRRYWTQEEDEKLIQYVNTHGKGKWQTVAEHLGLGKSGSSCYQRWKNHLSPDLVRGDFTEEEKDKILTLHSQLGNQWARIALGFPGRTDNGIKNFCNKEARLLKKKQAPAVEESGGPNGPESGPFDVSWGPIDPPQWDGGVCYDQQLGYQEAAFGKPNVGHGFDATIWPSNIWSFDDSPSMIGFQA